MKLKRNNYNINDRVTVKWGINNVPCIISGIETMLGAPTEIVYEAEPLVKVYEYTADKKKTKKQIYAFLITEDGRLYNTETEVYENPGTAIFYGHTNTDKDDALKEFYRIIPSSVWRNASTEPTRKALRIASDLIQE